MAATPETPPTVPGVTDTRATGLAQLAATPDTAAAGLRHVLPTEEPKPLPVCAFASSI